MNLINSVTTPARKICLKRHIPSYLSALITILSLTFSSGVFAAITALAQSPMLTLKSAPGLVMLTMGRDLPLYKAAYNDVTDIDGDNVPDTHFKPSFKYEGYFSHDRCYDYSKTSPIFTPTANATTNKYICTNLWSGNFLNWVTMARIDVLRKVLYGGKRSTDGASTTTLERTFVPQDSTLWGKEYTSIANDGYDIKDYTPLLLPNSNTRHMFANTTLQYANTSDRSAYFTAVVNNPLMIVYENRANRIWDLIATERPILGNNPKYDSSNPANGNPITQYIVRVKTCVTLNGKYEAWCTGYPSNKPTTYKPTGLLQKYGEAKTLAFGLISGTYDNNYSGGVLRQNIDDFSREIDPATGRYTTATGVIHHLNAFRPWGFGGSGFDWGCGNFDKVPANGACVMWGNPLGEMMLEGLNYFAGGSATAAFTANVGTAANTPESALNLKQPAWLNPYSASDGRTHTTAYPICARPIQMTIGDPKTSFDSDQLPGSAFPITPGFGAASSTQIGSLNVSTEADAIWASEFGGVTKNFFIGEGPGNNDQNPSAKTSSSFSNIRGHGPDSTTNQGSFYGSSVARYGKFSGLNNPALSAATKLYVDQVSIALDSSAPQIKIPLGNKIISIVPLSKSVDQYGITPDKTKYQQTGSISAFFIEEMKNMDSVKDMSVNNGLPYLKFVISYSDTDQGNDNEQDARVRYQIKVTGSSTLSIGMEYITGANGIEMHQGYVISGTTNDGLYLDVGGAPTFGVPPAPAVGYYLDTIAGESPGGAMLHGTGPSYIDIKTRLPTSTLTKPRNFVMGTGTGGEYVPHDMLWYAAKYGGAVRGSNGALNFKFKENGDPDSYYPANNPSTLAAQMGQAFQKAASLAVATSSAAASSGAKITGGSLIYQAGFDSTLWGGELRAFKVEADGNISSTPLWQATVQLPLPVTRTLVLGRGGSSKATINPYSYLSLTTDEQGYFADEATFQYLLGERNQEQSTGGKLRNRTSAIGDIVNSDPLYIGKADFGYTEKSYATFKGDSEPKLVGVGSNDGFYHLMSATDDATGGVERLAFIPQTITPSLSKLANPGYTHQYYVDGPAAFGHVKLDTTWSAVVAGSLGAGGKAVFALNASAANLATDGVLWEFSSSDASNGVYLGQVLNKPIVGQLNDTNIGAVLVGNGINSDDGRASLLVIDAKTGAVLRRCTPSDTGNTISNGMTSLAFIGTSSNNGKIAEVYGADYKGNIWRMNPNATTDTDCSNGAVKVFSAKDSTGKAQPITGELTVIKAPAGKSGYMILLGTGKYSSAEDPGNTDPQTLYGVWDDLGTTGGITRAKLISYDISGYDATKGTRTTSPKADINSGMAWYEPVPPALTSSYKGWKLDLQCTSCPAGERFVDKATLAGPSGNPTAYFLSIVPGADACQVGGGGWVTGINPYTGAYEKSFSAMTPNSAYVPGITPRGLFIVSKAATTKSAAADYLYVTRNYAIDSKTEPPGFDKVSGARQEGADGSGSESSGGEIPTSTTSTGVRRQVWRQIQ